MSTSDGSVNKGSVSGGAGGRRLIRSALNWWRVLNTEWNNKGLLLMESINLIDGCGVSGVMTALAVSSGLRLIMPPRTALALFTRQLPPRKVNI